MARPRPADVDGNRDLRARANAGTGIDGNVNAIRDITATVAVTWEPGQSLWLRWRDTNVSGNDDGNALDNVRFTAAVPEPASLAFLGLGAVGVLLRRRGR